MENKDSTEEAEKIDPNNRESLPTELTAEGSISVGEIFFNNSNPVNWENLSDLTELDARAAILCMRGLNPDAHDSEPCVPIRVRNDAAACGFFARTRHMLEVAISENFNRGTFHAWVAWADKHNFVIHSEFRKIAQCKVPATHLQDVKTAKPIPAQRLQEQEILRVIGELGYLAAALPKSIPGKAGVKAEVREKLS